MSANIRFASVCRRNARRFFFICPLALVAFAALALAGCGASRPVKYYVLSTENAPPVTLANPASTYAVTLLVARLSATHLYRDDRLVYGTGPVELGTYEYQRWAEPPVEMVQDSLIAALRATGQYRSVSLIGSNLRGDYILRGRLNALDEVDNPAITARFSIDLELYDPKTGATLWTGAYSHDEPVSGKKVSDVVEALDRNVRTGVQQLSANLGQYFMTHPPQATPAR